jgi:triphosphoribosyl-dephospho-CoA synthase
MNPGAHSMRAPAAPTPLLPDPREPRALRRFCRETARIAVGCLHTELMLYPKPGLVSPVDNGSHTDMTALTFMRSLFTLRHYFALICRAGIEDAPFSTLKQLGIEAEARMMRATGGVNTHRGAIFSLGLLCAAIGRARAQCFGAQHHSLRATMLIRWGEELAAHTRPAGGNSHGLQVAEAHAASGAREEAALGLPSVFEVGLPAMRRTLAAGRSMYLARIDALFTLMAHVSDTNVYYRGGVQGCLTVRQQAEGFLGIGGTAHPHWRDHALECHRVLVGHKLSPGGAADLLAATCLVHAVTTGSLP